LLIALDTKRQFNKASAVVTCTRSVRTQDLIALAKIDITEIKVQTMPDTRHSKASVSSSPSEVNVQGEFVTLSTLREMLQMQERMFKSFFDSIVTNVNTRLDSLTHSVAELKA